MFKKFISPLSLAIVIFLLLQIPISFLGISYQDEGLLHYYAFEILQGKIPYRDFFMVLAPGIYYMQAIINFITQDSYIISGRILYIITICLLLLLVSKSVALPIKWKYLVLVSIGCLFLQAGGFGLYTQAAIICLYFSYFTLEKGVKQKSFILFFIAGIVGTLVLFFKQSIAITTLPVLIFLSFLLPFDKRVRYGSSFISGLIFSTGIYLGYFVFHHAIDDFIYYQFLFASVVKSFQYTYLIHRVLVIPLIWFILILVDKSSKVKKIMLLTLLLVSGIYYLITGENRIGRLIEYVVDPVFYVTSLVYLLPIIVLFFFIKKYMIKFIKHNKVTISPHDLTLISLSLLLLGLYFGIASSGYNDALIRNNAVFFIPLIVLVMRLVQKRYKQYANVIQLSVIFFIVSITLHQAILQINPAGKVYNTYPKQVLTHNLPLTEATFIKVSSEESKDVPQVLSQINKYVPPDGTFLCFPYCPMLLALSERSSSSFFNDFYGELFMVSNQEKLINDLQKNPSLIVVQKEGFIEPLGNNEEERLDRFMSFLKSHYTLKFTYNNFQIFLPR